MYSGLRMELFLEADLKTFDCCLCTVYCTVPAVLKPGVSCPVHDVHKSPEQSEPLPSPGFIAVSEIQNINVPSLIFIPPSLPPLDWSC